MKVLAAIFLAIFAGIALIKAIIMWYEYAPIACQIALVFLLAVILFQAAISILSND